MCIHAHCLFIIFSQHSVVWDPVSLTLIHSATSRLKGEIGRITLGSFRDASTLEILLFGSTNL